MKLAREDAVSVVSQNDREISLRVRAPGRAVAPTVTLYLADEEWACDCDSRVDPCSHVAAAAIATTQSRPPSEVKRTPTTVSYRFVQKARSLILERYLVTGDREELLTSALTSLLARGSADLTPTHEEVKLDRVLQSFRRGQLEWNRLPEILALLTNCPDVRFQGKPVKTSRETIAPIGFVEDDKKEVVLRVDRNPAVTEVVFPGLALAGNTLRPLAETELTGETLQHLPLTRRFNP
ncbi:MAG TPA: SWIM zinc finger family protein, partial [Polyangiaceae bacterium]|nr:SWIM zinc finger family protein [Polyangiaceae bacterium]